MENLTNKRHVFNTLEMINSNDELYSLFQEEFGKDLTVTLVWDAVKNNICLESIIHRLMLLIPPFFKIGDKVFLHGAVKEGFDYTGDGDNEDTAVELYDMTTEMLTGESYQIFISGTDYLPYASPEEALEAIKFLKDIL